MRLATKLGTTGAIAFVGAGVALGVVLTGGSHSAPSSPVVVQRVADTAVAPSASPSVTRSAVTVVKPAVKNAAPLQEAPVAPTDQPSPTDTSTSPAPTQTTPAPRHGVVGPDGVLRPADPTQNTNPPPPLEQVNLPGVPTVDPSASPSSS
jgi:hypothetical protein